MKISVVFTTHFWNIIHAIIILSLCSVALWDVLKIIQDYVHKNEATLVKLVKIGPSIDFVEDARICLTYPLSVHQNFLKENTLEPDIFVKPYNIGALVDILERRRHGHEDTQLSVKELIYVSRYAGIIHQLDSGYYRKAQYDTSIPIHDFDPDNLITDQTLIHLINLIWYTLKPHIAQQIRSECNPEKEVIRLQYFTSKGICLRIMLSDILSASNQIPHQLYAKKNINFMLDSIKFDSSQIA